MDKNNKDILIQVVLLIEFNFETKIIIIIIY